MYYCDSDSSSSSSTDRGWYKSRKFDQDEGFVNVYTDGACIGNGTPSAAAGIGVFFGDNHYLNVSKPIPHRYRPTNQVAEILAVKTAATQAAKGGVQRLRIHTDSKFIISCVTKWMFKWKKNGWRKFDGGAVVNQQELKEMDYALSELSVEWAHVPAHAGIHGNEMADKFARQGAAAYCG